MRGLLAEDGSWAPVEPQKPGKAIDHQSAMMRRAELRARRQTPARVGKKGARIGRPATPEEWVVECASR